MRELILPAKRSAAQTSGQAPSEVWMAALCCALCAAAAAAATLHLGLVRESGAPVLLIALYLTVVAGGVVLVGGLVRERRRVRRALLRSEERFRLSADTVNALIYEWDVPSGQVVRSGGLLDLIGIPPADADAGFQWWVERIHPEDLAAARQMEDIIASAAENFSLKYRVRTCDGRWLGVWDRGRIVRDGAGRAVSVYGSAYDISRETEASRRLEELAEVAELQFRQLDGVFQSMTEGVAVFAPGGVMISMNQAMVRLHGFDPADNREFAAAELSACFESRLPGTALRPPLNELPAMRALKGESVSDYELEVRRVGEEAFRTVSYNASPVLNSDGQVALAVVTGRDVTDEKRADEALRESEIRYRTLADAVPSIVFTAIPEGRLDYCNRVWYEYTGADPAADPDDCWNAASHPEERERAANFAAADIAACQPHQHEYRLRSAEGAYRWFLCRVQPLKDADGRVVKWFGVCTDIEDRKQAEADIGLANEQLAAARDEAVEANRAKSVFLANMSHELRTPLTAIIGYAEMIAEEAQDRGREDELPDLANITTAGRQLLELINGLLDLAKVEAGRMNLDVTEFEIPRLVAESADTALPLARANGNELVVSCPADIGTMISDHAKVRQSLINLLSNACKFTEAGRVEIRVARRFAGGCDWIDFQVSDTGLGIDSDLVDRLFHDFVQADATVTRKHGGTGLGLAITKRFCTMMGGDVIVDSEPGQGSLFTISLPARAP